MKQTPCPVLPFLLMPRPRVCGDTHLLAPPVRRDPPFSIFEAFSRLVG